MKSTPIRKIGITGGIGSGKTTVCNLFELMGIPVYNADRRAKELMTTDQELKKNITTLLGKRAYTKTGALNRKYIAKKVFSDLPKLAMLNALVHPEVAKDAKKWFKKVLKKAPFALYEAALLYESGNHTSLDAIVVVTAPLPLRLERVMLRDHTTREAVMERINNQMDEAEKVKLADFVIHNDGKQSLVRQVVALYRELANNTVDN